MRDNRDLYELKLHELQFMLKKLKIHEKIYSTAAFEFSSVFKDHIDSLEDSSKRHKIRKIAGLAGENEKRTTSTAKRAKREGAKKRERKNPTKKQIQKEQQTSEYQPPTPSADKSIPKEYKGLYRKVVSATHPDKTGGDEEKNKILQDVNNAVLSKEYFKIIESAILLGLELPEEIKLDTRVLDEKISSVRKKIKEFTKSVAWEWYHIEEEEVKETLIQRYIHFLLNR